MLPDGRQFFYRLSGLLVDNIYSWELYILALICFFFLFRRCNNLILFCVEMNWKIKFSADLLLFLIVIWQPLVAVPSFICADAFSKFLPFCTGFAAGCMIWMVVAEVDRKSVV